jgi:hypothetical protein
MKIGVSNIGDTSGTCIPKIILEHYNIKKYVQPELRKECLILRASAKKQTERDENIIINNDYERDKVVDGNILIPSNSYGDEIETD